MGGEAGGSRSILCAPLRDVARGPQAGRSLWSALQKAGQAGHAVPGGMEGSHGSPVTGYPQAWEVRERPMRIWQGVHQQEDTGQLRLPKDVLRYAAEVTLKGSLSNWGTRSPRTWSMSPAGQHVPRCGQTGSGGGKIPRLVWGWPQGLRSGG